MKAKRYNRKQIKERLDLVTLERGSHSSPEAYRVYATDKASIVPDHACAMEALSWVLKQPWSDSPHDVDPFLIDVVRELNDLLMDAERQYLKQVLPYLPGTMDTRGAQRAQVVATWYIKWLLPRMYQAAPELRPLVPLVERLNLKGRGMEQLVEETSRIVNLNAPEERRPLLLCEVIAMGLRAAFRRYLPGLGRLPEIVAAGFLIDPKAMPLDDDLMTECVKVLIKAAQLRKD